jgi:hypothetical protein
MPQTSFQSVVLPARNIFGLGSRQGDEIGRNFAIWAKFFGIGEFFLEINRQMI